MGVFLDLGYNDLAIDQRNSGDNLAPYNTFGVLESYDILDAIDYAKNEMSEEGKLVLWGESYGGPVPLSLQAGTRNSLIT